MSLVSMASAAKIVMRPGYLTPDDLIHPDQLTKLTQGKDYILLRHTPGANVADKIQHEGLRSLTDLAQHKDASPEILEKYHYRKKLGRFSNDPSLIYFSPVVEGAPHGIWENDVVVAAKPQSTHIFNGNERAREKLSGYLSSSMTADEYRNIMGSKSEETYLDNRKQLRPWSAFKTGSDYIAESIVQVDRIDPEFFVKPDQLPNVSESVTLDVKPLSARSHDTAALQKKMYLPYLNLW